MEYRNQTHTSASATTNPGRTADVSSAVPSSAGGAGDLQFPRAAAAKALARRLFSFPALLGMLLVGGMVVSVRSSLPDPDTWYHLAAGEEILATHAWPTVDRFSFTTYGHESMTFEWLGDVLVAEVARLGDLSGLMLLLVGLSSLLIVLLYYYATLRSGN